MFQRKKQEISLRSQSKHVCLLLAFFIFAVFGVAHQAPIKPAMAQETPKIKSKASPPSGHGIVPLIEMFEMGSGHDKYLISGGIVLLRPSKRGLYCVF
jgi:hypothetical protein